VARRRAQTASGLAGLLAIVTAVFVFCRGSPQPPSGLGVPSEPPASPPGQSQTDPDEPDTSGPGPGSVPVTRVVDGDTFHVLRGGKDITIRLIGIDTPEVGWYGGEAECYGAAAGRFVRGLLEGGRVRLEFDADRIDPYGRTLAYAYLEDDRMLNVLLVRRGFAEVTIYAPNDRHETRLTAVEADARHARAGLWAACR
jgi:micrococcal nuclease